LDEKIILIKNEISSLQKDKVKIEDILLKMLENIKDPNN